MGKRKSQSTIQVFIPDGTHETYSGMMEKAMRQLEYTVFFPAIISMTPKYENGHGLILTVTYDNSKQ